MHLLPITCYQIPDTCYLLWDPHNPRRCWLSARCDGRKSDEVKQISGHLTAEPPDFAKQTVCHPGGSRPPGCKWKCL